MCKTNLWNTSRPPSFQRGMTVEPPVVHASADGTMGWMIARVRIGYTETDASGKTTNENTVGAWMSS
jgi:hypothetical protein